MAAESEDVSDHRKLIPVYAQVLSRLGDLSLLCSQEGDDDNTSEKTSPKKRQSPHQHLLESLEGKHVKDFFSPKEESFLRLVIRKYLPFKFGSELAHSNIGDDDDELEELEDDEQPSLDKYSKNDVAFLFATCEKVDVQRQDQGDSIGLFQFNNLDVPGNSDSSPQHHGKRTRRGANTDDGDVEELPGVVTRGRTTTV